MTMALMVDDMRRTLRDRVRALPPGGEPRLRVFRLRALLQELGVHCDESLDLQDLDAVLLASERGAEALVASRLTDDERLFAYARIVARLLLGELHGPLDAKMEYAGGIGGPIKREREESKAVLALAEAIASGDLDAAPRPLYQDVPHLTFAFTPRSAARSTLGGFHLWSGYWYRRSTMYRRWRSRRGVSDAIRGICSALDRVAIPAA
jgi:hypothetical protein